MRKINEIIVHCTATKEGKDYTVADIDKWHKAKGWKCIGYATTWFIEMAACTQGDRLMRSEHTALGIIRTPLEWCMSVDWLMMARPRRTHGLRHRDRR